MRILFLTDNFPPEFNAPATRTFEHCKVWAMEGNDVTVITCQPNFPQGVIYPGYKNKLIQREVIDGIKIIRVWTFMTSNEGFFKRSLDYLSFGIASFIVGLFIKADIIIGTSPQFFTAISARWLGFFKFTPWIMEIRDLWPESIAAVGELKKTSLIYKFLTWIELGLYKSAYKIITVTNSFKLHLVARSIEETKIHIVTNGVDLAMYKNEFSSNTLEIKNNLQGKFIIGYIGTIGLAHGLEFIIKAMSKVKDESIHLIIQGEGAEKQNLMKLSNTYGLRNVTFLNSVSKIEVPKYISIIDVALVNLKKSETFNSVIPSKIFENAAMGKPILIGVEGESKDLIESYKCGLAYEPENEIDFLDKLNKIKEGVSNNLFKEGCNNLSSNYDRKELALKMLNIFKK